MTEVKEVKLRKLLEKNLVKGNKIVDGIITKANTYLIEDIDDFVFEITNFFEKK